MNIQVGKWGNSLGLRIPHAFAKELGISEGSDVDLQQVNGALVIKPVESPRKNQYSLSELLKQVTPETVHHELDWGASVGAEEW